MINTAKTKIIATIGPSSWDPETLKELFKNGMEIARINASFADAKEIERVTKAIREISPRIAILLDTQGTKIRVTGLEKDLEIKEPITISSSNTKDNTTIKVSYPDLHLNITRNTIILLDDGTIELKVSDIKESTILCDVIQPGTLKPNKTVSIPEINLAFPTLTEKDKDDIQEALKQNLDFIALSFTRNANDIKAIKDVVGDNPVKIIAKIENQEGLDNFDEILQQADAIMIARGDLGVETPLEQVPAIQKQLIYKCRCAGKPVIVATQMLESMRENKKPTRAEVSDVANAVMDGADALMLSAETSTGKYPIQAVQTMTQIAIQSEKIMQPSTIYGRTNSTPEVDEIGKAVTTLTETIPLKTIVIMSNSQSTVGSITRHRPNITVWTISSSLQRIRQDLLYRGTKTLHINDMPSDRDESTFQAIQQIYTHGELDLNDKIAIITGSSIKNKSCDLILEIVTIKDILA